MSTQEISHRHQNLLGAVPAGLTLENCRKSGLDVVRLWISQPREQRMSWVLFGALSAIVGLEVLGKGEVIAQIVLAVSLLAIAMAIIAPEPRQLLSLSGERLTIVSYRRWWWPIIKDQQCILCGDIESISTRSARQSQPSSLEIKANSVVRRVGAGLSETSLRWLKDRLIMEVAGLTWRPLSKTSVGANGFEAIDTGNPLLIKPDLALRLISLFLDQSAYALKLAGEALRKSDMATVAKQAHWMKTSSASVGAHHLSELCQLLESHARDGDALLSKVILLEAERTLPGVEVWLSDLKVNAIERVLAHDYPSQVQKRTALPTKAQAKLDVRVLVADDSEISRELAFDVLSGMVRSVTLAQSGAQALELWRAQAFDIILMDCDMDDIDGLEATRRIRREENELGLVRVPIVALTGYTVLTMRDECLKAGMDAYLTKPYRQESIRSTLLEWVVKTRATVQQTDRAGRE